MDILIFSHGDICLKVHVYWQIYIIKYEVTYLFFTKTNKEHSVICQMSLLYWI